MKLREFITPIAATAAAWPLAANAQQSGKIPRIGLLGPKISKRSCADQVIECASSDPVVEAATQTAVPS